LKLNSVQIYFFQGNNSYFKKFYYYCFTLFRWLKAPVWQQSEFTVGPKMSGQANPATTISFRLLFRFDPLTSITVLMPLLGLFCAHLDGKLKRPIANRNRFTFFSNLFQTTGMVESCYLEFNFFAFAAHQYSSDSKRRVQQQSWVCAEHSRRNQVLLEDHRSCQRHDSQVFILRELTELYKKIHLESFFDFFYNPKFAYNGATSYPHFSQFQILLEPSTLKRYPWPSGISIYMLRLFTRKQTKTCFIT
jgi:hypothetical protein